MALIPYIIRSFRGGISDESDKGIAGSFKFGHGLDIHKKDDTLSCNQRMETVLDETRGMADYGGTTMTGLINVFVSASDGSTYAFSDRGSIFSRTGEGNWIFVYQDENGAIKGACEHEDSNGNNYLYWASGTSISRKPFPGVNSAPDTATMRWTDVTMNWKVEDIVDTFWKTMKMINGDLTICNGESLAQLSDAGAFDPSVMTIYPNNILTCLEERDDFVIMGSWNRDYLDESYLWSSIAGSENYIQKKKIPTKEVNALIYTELPLLQAGSEGQIYYSDFTNVIPITKIIGGGEVTPHGVTVENNLALFGFYGGDYPGLWSFGRKAKNRPQVLNYEYRLVNEHSGTGSTTTIGAVINTGGIVLASWGATDLKGTYYGVDQVSSTMKADAIYEGLEFDGGKPYWKKSVNQIKVIMSPMEANTAISIKFKGDKETDWRYAFLGSESTTFSVTGATEAIFGIDKPMHIYEVGAELTPYNNNTPEILSITSYLDGSGWEMA